MKKNMVSSLLILALGVNLSVFAKNKKTIPHVAPKETESSAPSKREEGEFVIEKKSDGKIIKYKKKTTYDFEGANIEGLYNKPSGSYISNIKDVKGKSIIRVRENFDAEVLDSARLIK